VHFFVALVDREVTKQHQFTVKSHNLPLNSRIVVHIIKILGKPASTNSLLHSLAQEFLFQSSVRRPKEKKNLSRIAKKIINAQKQVEQLLHFFKNERKIKCLHTTM
jgi:hypothetical protein